MPTGSLGWSGSFVEMTGSIQHPKFWWLEQFGQFASGTFSESGFTGSFTGSYNGDGSNLNNVPVAWSEITSKPSELVSGSTNSGSFSGSFEGDGTGLTGVALELTVETKTGSYTLTNSDTNKQFRVTGTTTITLPSLLTWANNEGCEVVNIGINTVTIATAGAVAINNDASDVTLESFEGIVLMPLAPDSYLGTGNHSGGGGVV